MSTHGAQLTVEWVLTRSDVEGPVYTFHRLDDATQSRHLQAQAAAGDFAEMCWQMEINGGFPLSESISVNVRRRGSAESFLFMFRPVPRALLIR